jgi:replicative DNA helicase
MQRQPKPEMGYLPPHALEIEAAILGAMMLEAPALPAVLAIITTPQVFYPESHQAVFSAIRTLFDAGEPVDQLTVTRQLRTMGVLEKHGGAHFVAGLTLKVNSAANVGHYSRIVQQLYMRRELIETGRGLVDYGYDESRDELELLTQAQLRLIALHAGLETRPMVTAESLYDEVFDELATAMKTPGMTGVNTGLRELNKVTGGWQPSDLIILAARPGMGKTAAMLHFASTAALNYQQAVAIFSLEMPRKQLIKRMIVSEAQGEDYTNVEVSRGEIRDGEAGLKRLYEASLRLRTPRLIIDDTPALGLEQLRAKAVRLKAEQDVQLLIVDYIQLVKGQANKGNNREQEVGSVSRGLKALAKELNIPVIALAQLSRDVEKRGGEKKPQLSDLRESGSIEQDADVIVFLWRGEYYDLTEDADGESLKDTILFDIAKHRNGPVMEVMTGCTIKNGRFFDLKAPVNYGDVQVGPTKIGGTLPASTEHRPEDDDNDLPF